MHQETLYFWVLRVVENVEKPDSEVKLSQEMCTSPTVHLSDCRNGKAPINNDMNVEKGETSSATVTVAVPIVDSSEVQNFIEKVLQLDTSGDPSTVTGDTILASLSSLRPDLSHWKSPSQGGNKIWYIPIHDATDVDLDGLEGNLAANIGIDKA
ncbi:hypothetical protein Godav_001187 [Gossypium davidsonii]|uniref:Uncharacterized protein n=1 Tax=Gossypium davidsonii TaxID=34287 RepID=A0A7J8T247_GOSDV|nr:hypothetical protein [Gossypium davidsonii]